MSPIFGMKFTFICLPPNTSPSLAISTNLFNNMSTRDVSLPAQPEQCPNLTLNHAMKVWLEEKDSRIAMRSSMNSRGLAVPGIKRRESVVDDEGCDVPYPNAVEVQLVLVAR